MWHNTIIQPQLRNFIKKMLMSIYGRILELKQILIEEDSSIYTYVLKNVQVILFYNDKTLF